MGTIYVKAHRRGKSVVRAYTKVRTARERLVRLYNVPGNSSTRQKQLETRSKLLWNIQSRIDTAMSGKIRVGVAVLPKKSRTYDSLAIVNAVRGKKSRKLKNQYPFDD